MARPKKPAEEPVQAKWFKVWIDWSEIVATLSDEQAGRLFKAMLGYSASGIDPKFEDSVLQAYWGFIVIQLRLDRKKYINQVLSNRKAGKISAENKSKKTQKKLYQKNELSPTANADGTRDSQQVLTSVNEGKKTEGKKTEGKKTEGSASPFLSADHFNMDTSKDFLISQRAVDILKQQLGEKLTESKMGVVSKFIREHEAMTDSEIASGVKYKLLDLTEDEDE